MNKKEMIAGLRDEIERLTQVLALLEQGGEATGASSPRTPAKKQLQTTDGRRGKRNPEARARIAVAQQKRQRARRAAAKKAGAAR